MKAANTSREKGPITGGQYTVFYCNWGASKGTGWAIAHLSLYIKRGPVLSMAFVSLNKYAKLDQIFNSLCRLHFEKLSNSLLRRTPVYMGPKSIGCAGMIGHGR